MTDVRIVTLQMLSAAIDYPAHQTPEAFAVFNAECKARAEAELAQAYADGYEIVSQSTGGNERVLLTTWVLHPKLIVSFQGYPMLDQDEARAHQNKPG